MVRSSKGMYGPAEDIENRFLMSMTMSVFTTSVQGPGSIMSLGGGIRSQALAEIATKE